MPDDKTPDEQAKEFADAVADEDRGWEPLGAEEQMSLLEATKMVLHTLAGDAGLPIAQAHALEVDRLLKEQEGKDEPTFTDTDARAHMLAVSVSLLLMLVDELKEYAAQLEEQLDPTAEDEDPAEAELPDWARGAGEA